MEQLSAATVLSSQIPNSTPAEQRNQGSVCTEGGIYIGSYVCPDIPMLLFEITDHLPKQLDLIVPRNFKH